MNIHLYCNVSTLSSGAKKINTFSKCSCYACKLYYNMKHGKYMHYMEYIAESLKPDIKCSKYVDCTMCNRVGHFCSEIQHVASDQASAKSKTDQC